MIILYGGQFTEEEAGKLLALQKRLGHHELTLEEKRMSFAQWLYLNRRISG